MGAEKSLKTGVKNTFGQAGEKQGQNQGTIQRNQAGGQASEAEHHQRNQNDAAVAVPIGKGRPHRSQDGRGLIQGDDRGDGGQFHTQALANAGAKGYAMRRAVFISSLARVMMRIRL